MREVLHDQLPTPARAALRLVCRAARDDLVDGHCKVLRVANGNQLEQAIRMAPRLRRLERAELPRCDGSDAKRHIKFLRRLPGRGAALQELRVENIWVYEGANFPAEAFSAALAGLTALRRLEARVSAKKPNEVAEALGALRAGVAAAPAGARLALEVNVESLEWYPTAEQEQALRSLPPAERLESLRFERSALEYWVPQLLLEPGMAAALTALQSLSLVGPSFDEPPQPQAWRAPWAARLTRLELCQWSLPNGFLAETLPPRSLPALRSLVLKFFDCKHAPAASELAAALAACDAAALKELVLGGVCFDDEVARLLEALPALSSLQLLDFGGCTEVGRHPGDSGDAACAAIRGARLAPLTSLAVDCCAWLGDAPLRLADVLSAPWAAALRELTLVAHVCSDDGLCALGAALPQLEHLRTLRLVNHGFGGPPGEYTLEQAAKKGLADGWAPQIRELELLGHVIDPYTAHALLQLPWRRLERLKVAAMFPTSEEVAAEVTNWDEDEEEEWSVEEWTKEELSRQAFVDECVRWLPALKQLSIIRSTDHAYESM